MQTAICWWQSGTRALPVPRRHCPRPLVGRMTKPSRPRGKSRAAKAAAATATAQPEGGSGARAQLVDDSALVAADASLITPVLADMLGIPVGFGVPPPAERAAGAGTSVGSGGGSGTNVAAEAKPNTKAAPRKRSKVRTKDARAGLARSKKRCMCSASKRQGGMRAWGGGRARQRHHQDALFACRAFQPAVLCMFYAVLTSALARLFARTACACGPGGDRRRR